MDRGDIMVKRANGEGNISKYKFDDTGKRTLQNEAILRVVQWR